MNVNLSVEASNIIISAIIVGIGILSWAVTYIFAPRARKKSGHFVSGTPIVGAVFVAVGFLFSPGKWLALAALIEPILLMIMSIRYNRISKDKEQ